MAVENEIKTTATTEPSRKVDKPQADRTWNLITKQK
jgi:hypothetical protein